jgi:formate hydrogenlyase subunit 3/multisubunit Na+/H+ antiporter MnhD subunit
MASVARHAPPIAAVFLFAVFNAVIWIMLLDVMQEYTWLVHAPGVLTALQTAGLVTALTGGGLAFASHDFGRIMAYGTLADWGCALIMLGLGIPAGVSAVILGLLMRPVSLMLLAMGMASARARAKSTEFSDLVGIAWNSPWTAAALLLGGFSLAGIPPLPGFLVRWTQVRLLANGYHVVLALAVLAVTVGVSAGVLRGLDFIVMRPRDLHPADPRHQPESRWIKWLIAGGLLTWLLVILYPALFDALLRAMVASYTFLD